MTDRQFLRLNDDWAIAHDRLQWIVQNRRKCKAAEKWQPIAFIASEKRVLSRVLREKGVEVCPEAEAALNGLSATFREFLAQQDAARPSAAAKPSVPSAPSLPGGGRMKGNPKRSTALNHTFRFAQVVTLQHAQAEADRPANAGQGG